MIIFYTVLLQFLPNRVHVENMCIYLRYNSRHMLISHNEVNYILYACILYAYIYQFVKYLFLRQLLHPYLYVMEKNIYNLIIHIL
jgi:hypothetical protein